MYFSIEPETSQRTTSLRGTSARRRNARSIGSPPVASERRASRRRSTTRPRRCGRRRRERRCGRRVTRGHGRGRGAGELLGGHRGEVLLAQDLVRAPADLGRLLALRRTRRRPRVRRRARCSSVRRSRRRLGAPGLDLGRHPHEPGAEGAVERVDLLGLRDERRAERPVDVLRVADVDLDEAVQRVAEPAGADLEPGLAQAAAEGDDLANDPGVGRCSCDAGRAGLLDEPRERGVADELEVLVVLEHRAQRLLDDRRVELLAAERGERVRPVDRLGDAGRLREVEAAQTADERGRLRGEPLGDVRRRGGARSRSRARASDARSSGRGSGA